MESLITAAARALEAGDPLGALNRVALRNDPPALALRGIAMAQLGDLIRAKALLRSAVRSFGPGEAVARARCVVAEAEIALVCRDLSRPPGALSAARRTLEKHGDLANAAYALQIEARWLLLIGRFDQAERTLSELGSAPLPPAAKVIHELVVAGIAMRRLRTNEARAALVLAAGAARQAGIPALAEEVAKAEAALNSPAGRLFSRGIERPLLLAEVEELFASRALVVDTFHHAVRQEQKIVALGTRPLLFALVRHLARAWPDDVARNLLMTDVFRARRPDESDRVRLRVEIGRLRAELKGLAGVNATQHGYVLAPCKPHDVVVLERPHAEKHAAVLAFLADGEPWSSSALAVALGTSPRSVQRALEDLARAGKAQSFGRGRARRWTIPPIPGFPTSLLLPGPLPGT